MDMATAMVVARIIRTGAVEARWYKKMAAPQGCHFCWVRRNDYFGAAMDSSSLSMMR